MFTRLASLQRRRTGRWGAGKRDVLGGRFSCRISGLIPHLSPTHPFSPKAENCSAGFSVSPHPCRLTQVKELFSGLP